MPDPANLAQPRTTPETLPLHSAIERFSTRGDIHVFGHGTPTELSAQGIVNEGLRLKVPDLFSSVVGLENIKTNPNAVEYNVRMIENAHKGHRFFVILGVQRYADPEDIPHNRYLSSIVQPEIDENNEEIHRVDNRFVAGYFDADTNLFVVNPDFDPRYDPELMLTTSDMVIEERRIDPRASDGLGNVAVGTNLDVPSIPVAGIEDNGDEVPKGWVG